VRAPARGPDGGVPHPPNSPANRATLPPTGIAPEVGQIVNKGTRSGIFRPSPHLRPSGELEPLVQGGVAAYRRGHQKAIALAPDALDVVGIDVGMADDHVVLLAGVHHPRHPLEHLGMLVLPGIPELLIEVTLADHDRDTP